MRLLRSSDVLPPELARRFLTAAEPGELQTLAPARVAGRSVPGVRVVPASPATAIGHIDIWADADTGVALRVSVVARTSDVAGFESQFLDVSLSPPDRGLVTFTRPDNTRTGRPQADPVQQVASSSPVKLPDELAGLTRGAGQTGAVGTYGSGFDTVGVAAVPRFAIQQAFPDTIALVDRPWGGQARVLSTALVNAMALDVDGISYVVAGAVTVDELDRIAAVINETRPGAP